MTSVAAPAKRALNPFHFFTFLASAVAFWAGVDAMNPWIAVLSVLVLLPVTFQLFDKVDSKPANAVAAFIRRCPRKALALQVVAGSVLLWLSIDVHSTLGAVAGAVLTVSTAISLIKNGRNG